MYSETIYTANQATGGGPPASTHWRQPVPDLASLPSDDPEGTSRYVDSEDAVYTYTADPSQNNPPQSINGWVRSAKGLGVQITSGVPPSGPINGQLWVDTSPPNESVLYGYDLGRSRWLSDNDYTIAASKEGIVNKNTPEALSSSGGVFMSSTPTVIPFNGTISKLIARSSNLVGWTAEIQDEAGMVYVTVPVTSGSVKNINLNAEFPVDVQLVFVVVPNGINRVENPRIEINIKRRFL